MGKSGRGEGTKIQTKGHSRRVQDLCCFVCGNKGFSELLFYCSDCSQLAVHKYCFGIVPGSTEDKEGIYWSCDYCCQSLNASSKDHPDNVSTETSERKPKRYKTDLILVEEQPKPLCTLFPEGYQNNVQQAEATEDFQPFVSYVMEHPTEIARGVVLLASPSGKIIIDETSLLDDSSDSSQISRLRLTYMASSEDMIMT